ncbi:unnamed protein product [Hydatigera taeniaeformis]|uniref:Uncharacterized protein n=1 Tax=Hydatigena taeniaeformis TaxID=6205 RepID=A0A0R3WYX3_HYDTA|nr:unnamed protein product [Hydatigera taeniaeformis]
MVLDIYLQYEEDQAIEPSIGTVDETSSLVSSSSGRQGASQIPTNSTSYSTSPVHVHAEGVRDQSTRFCEDRGGWTVVIFSLFRWMD